MVNKEVIEEIILKSILSMKCSSDGNYFNLNKNIRDAFKEFDKETDGKVKEQIRMFDNEGNIHYEAQDEEHLVEWDTDTVEMICRRVGSLHSIHNHPTPYAGDDYKGKEEIANLFPTGLSKADMQNLYETAGIYHYDTGGWTIFPMFKSETAVCSVNNSRATLIRGENYNWHFQDENSQIGAFNTAIDNYHEAYFNFTLKGVDEVNNHMIQWYTETSSKKEVSDDDYHKEMVKFTKKYIKDNYIKAMQPVIDEFHDCNMKLELEY